MLEIICGICPRWESNLNMLISMPLPGQFGLFPKATIKNLQNNIILLTNVPLIEKTPGNYSADVDIPTKSEPITLVKPEDVPLPIIEQLKKKPIPVKVSVDIPGVGIAVGSNVLTPHEIQPTIIPKIPIEIDSIERCPYCFSKIGLPHEIDNFIWSDDPTLCMGSKVMEQYQGYMQIKANHIEELQNNRIKLEEDCGIFPLTKFSPIDTTYFYQNQCQYILELRESTEKILDYVDMSKETYFNYNEDNVEMRTNHQLDWIDAVDLTLEELTKFQVKAIHIEDLRHYIQTIIEIERWENNFEEGPIIPYGNFTLLGDIAKPPLRPWSGSTDGLGEKYFTDVGTVHWGSEGTKGHQTSFNLWGEVLYGEGFYSPPVPPVGGWKQVVIGPTNPGYIQRFDLSGSWTNPIFINKNKIFNIGISGSGAEGYITVHTLHSILYSILFISFNINTTSDSSQSGYVDYHLIYSTNGASVLGPDGWETFYIGYSEIFDGYKVKVRDYRNISSIGDVQLDIWNDFSKKYVDYFHKVIWNPGSSTFDPVYDSEGHLIPTLTKFQTINFSGSTEGSAGSYAGPLPFPPVIGVAASLNVTFDNIGLEQI